MLPYFTNEQVNVLKIVLCLLLLILLFFFLARCAGVITPANKPATTMLTINENETSLEARAAEFRNLRLIKGHFEGGDWNDDTDKYMGRKHQLMIQLGSQFGTGEYATTEIIRLLGPPDLIVGKGDELYSEISDLPEFTEPVSGSYQFIIYYWRGRHDFLYFTSQGETIINSGWWYAFE